jgi:hypothetical protein
VSIRNIESALFQANCAIHGQCCWIVSKHGAWDMGLSKSSKRQVPALLLDAGALMFGSYQCTGELAWVKFMELK